MNKYKINKACDYIVELYFNNIPVKEAIKQAKEKFNIKLNMTDILMNR